MREGRLIVVVIEGKNAGPFIKVPFDHDSAEIQ